MYKQCKPQQFKWHNGCHLSDIKLQTFATFARMLLLILLTLEGQIVESTLVLFQGIKLSP